MNENGKARDGYRVYGNCTAPSKEPHLWYFSTREEADRFAQSLATTNGKEVDVLLYVGSWRLAKPPLEFIPACNILYREQKEGVETPP